MRASVGPEPPVGADPGVPDQHKILIVDDEEKWISFFDLFLEGRYSFKAETTLARGVATARSYQPDLIFLDNIFPGVHTGADVVKSALAGASAVMLASELLRNGADRIPTILGEVGAWMVEHEYENYQQMLGSLSQKSVPDPAAYERANYIKALKTFKQLP